jgi:hypothetical protein
LPIASALQFVKGLLNDIGMPLGLPGLAAYLNPPDPNVEAQFPSAYILSASGPEKRLTNPRNRGPGTSAGLKTLDHEIRVLMVYEIAGDDPDADTLFAGIMDGAMKALRFAWPMPAILTDPHDGTQTQAVNAGEGMSYEKWPPQAAITQGMTLWQGLVTIPVQETLQA